MTCRDQHPASPRGPGSSGIAAMLVVVFLLAACGGQRIYHQEETFGTDTKYRREFTADAQQVCRAARTVLLGQGFVVSVTQQEKELSLVASKEFKEEEKRFAVLQVHASCARHHQGSVLFVTAVESHFDVRQSREQTTIGFPIVAPIYLSQSASSESQVKTGGETIGDRKFYERFFTAVGHELREP